MRVLLVFGLFVAYCWALAWAKETLDPIGLGWPLLIVAEIAAIAVAIAVYGPFRRSRSTTRLSSPTHRHRLNSL